MANGGVAPSPIFSGGAAKIAQVIALLERPRGATLAELVAAPVTAAYLGIRKKVELSAPEPERRRAQAARFKAGPKAA
jgi:hypothetical protein